VNKENDLFSSDTVHLPRNFDCHSRDRILKKFGVHEKRLGKRAIAVIALVRTRYMFCPSTFMVLLGP